MAEPAIPPFYNRWLGSAVDVNARQVFFIVGCQKSGTTWVQKLLNGHRQIACQGEGHLCDTAASLLQQVAAQYNQSQSRTNRLAESLLLSDDDLRGLLKIFCDCMLAKYIDAADAPTERIRAVGDKTPEHANAIGLLRQLYPGARFIHIIRDGRDAAVSGWAHLQRQNKAGQFPQFADYAEYFAAQHWAPYISNARTAGEQIGEDYLEVRYEQLHDQPEAIVRTMLELLRVESNDEAVGRCIEAGSFTTLTGGRSQGEEDRHSHFRKGVVGDWQQQFDDAAIRRFDAAAGKLLDALGYAGQAV